MDERVEVFFFYVVCCDIAIVLPMIYCNSRVCLSATLSIFESRSCDHAMTSETRRSALSLLIAFFSFVIVNPYCLPRLADRALLKDMFIKLQHTKKTGTHGALNVVFQDCLSCMVTGHRGIFTLLFCSIW